MNDRLEDKIKIFSGELEEVLARRSNLVLWEAVCQCSPRIGWDLLVKNHLQFADLEDKTTLVFSGPWNKTLEALAILKQENYKRLENIYSKYDLLDEFSKSICQQIASSIRNTSKIHDEWYDTIFKKWSTEIENNVKNKDTK